MSRRSTPDVRRRGFTLIEMSVSLALLVLVMVLAMTLLFSMRSFAERQTMVTAPRQTARRAIDYVSFFTQGAGDLNQLSGNPNALVMAYRTSPTGPNLQASYDNLTSGQTSFGDKDTDVVSMTTVTNPVRLDIDTISTPPGSWGTSSFDIILNYQVGCGAGPTYSPADNDANIDSFLRAIGAYPFPPGGPAPASNPIFIVAGLAQQPWTYAKLKDRPTSDCSLVTTGKTNILSLKTSAGQATEMCSPGFDATQPVQGKGTLISGIGFAAFRVRTQAGSGLPALEQKNGLFDPNGPDTGFFPIVENVEDFQVAYLFQDGTVRNASGSKMTNATGVPDQQGPFLGAPAANAPDIVNVVGVRLTIIGRSPRLPIGSLKLTSLSTGAGQHFRPGVEDGVAGTIPTGTGPFYDYYRLTTTLLLRNRVLGS